MQFIESRKFAVGTVILKLKSIVKNTLKAILLLQNPRYFVNQGAK